MNDVVLRGSILKRRKEFIENVVCRLISPGSRAVEIHANVRAVWHSAFQDPVSRRMTSQTKLLGEMLQQRGLAIARIPAEYDQSSKTFSDVIQQ
jgi:hypothetical protein